VTRYRISHETRYRYSKSVSLGHNEAHLLPREAPHQRVLQSELRIQPEPAVCLTREDFFGNAVTYFAVQEPHDTLVITAESQVEITSVPTPDLDGSPAWEAVRERLRVDLGEEVLEARQFLLDSPFVSAAEPLHRYAMPSFPSGRPLLAAVHDLMRRIHADFVYDPAFTTVATPLAEVLAHRRGVCQDFAHLAIGCLRSLGLAARYVSGYLETVPPPGQPRVVGADASHAWFSVYVPGQGWVDFDPTNDQIPLGQHITTAWGRDYTDITPLKGVIFGGKTHKLSVAVDVSRV
jgi:transglutaminase-like putative cysteine protease